MVQRRADSFLKTRKPPLAPFPGDKHSLSCHTHLYLLVLFKKLRPQTQLSWTWPPYSAGLMSAAKCTLICLCSAAGTMEPQ